MRVVCFAPRYVHAALCREPWWKPVGAGGVNRHGMSVYGYVAQTHDNPAGRSRRAQGSFNYHHNRRSGAEQGLTFDDDIVLKRRSNMRADAFVRRDRFNGVCNQRCPSGNSSAARRGKGLRGTRWN